MHKQGTRISALTIPITIVCGLLASTVSTAAEMEARACSNRSLSGHFGSVAIGVLIGVPGLPAEAQFRSIGASTFDGAGNFTSVEHTVINGATPAITWLANFGTYSVNPDCTGTMVLNTPNSPVPLTLGLVIVRHGEEVRTVLDSNAISTVFLKVD